MTEELNQSQDVFNARYKEYSESCRSATNKLVAKNFMEDELANIENEGAFSLEQGDLWYTWSIISSAKYGKLNESIYKYTYNEVNDNWILTQLV